MANVVEKAADYLQYAAISPSHLKDKLSEFLMVEKGGIKLYQKALQIVKDAKVKERFQVFYEQTRKHEQILTKVMRELKIDPSYVSPGARLAEQKAEGLLKTMGGDSLDSNAAELNAIENIILAETKDQADWEMLGKISRQSEDERIREVLRPAVYEVEPEEDTHLLWTKQQMTRLEFDALTR